jgi:hypothetical protein
MDPEDLSVRFPKPKGNTVLTIALTLCFGGMLLLLGLIAAFGVVVIAGDRILVSNFIYLIAVLLYLGLIVGGLAAVGLNLSLPRWTSPWPSNMPSRSIRRPVATLLRGATTRAFVMRSASSALFRPD